MQSKKHSNSEKRLQTFGRLKSKKLTPNQQRLFDEFLPTVSFTNFADLPKDKELVLEIGFGGGEHLVHQALLNPDKFYIGCEPFINGSVKALRQIEDEKIDNIVIFNGDVRDVLDGFPAESLSQVFILHPDPWPKKRHYKRRLITTEFLALLSGKIRQKAVLRFATDDYDYAKWSINHFLNCPNFEWTAKAKTDWETQPDDHIQTKYQKKALKAGRKAVFFHFEKI